MCSTVAEMGDRLVTIHMGRKEPGSAVPLSRGGDESSLAHRGVPPYQVASSSIHSSRLATTDMNRKLGLCPL